MVNQFLKVLSLKVSIYVARFIIHAVKPEASRMSSKVLPEVGGCHVLARCIRRFEATA